MPRGVTVVTFAGGRAARTFRGNDRILSAVLPDFDQATDAFFDGLSPAAGESA
jgi:hypothetical protein